MDLGRITANLGGASCFTPQLCVSSSVEASDLEPGFSGKCFEQQTPPQTDNRGSVRNFLMRGPPGCMRFPNGSMSHKRLSLSSTENEWNCSIFFFPWGELYIKLTISKWTVQAHMVHSQCYTAITSKIFWPPPKKPYRLYSCPPFLLSLCFDWHP